MNGGQTGKLYLVAKLLESRNSGLVPRAKFDSSKHTYYLNLWRSNIFLKNLSQKFCEILQLCLFFLQNTWEQEFIKWENICLSIFKTCLHLLLFTMTPISITILIGLSFESMTYGWYNASRSNIVLHLSIGLVY